MNKYVYLNLLCGFSLVCGSVCADNESEEKIHAEIGNRQISNVDYESRATDLLNAVEKTVAEPSELMLQASNECRQSEKTVSSLEDADLLQEKGVYFTTNPNAMHFVTAVTQPYGSPVQLEDGSIWGVYSEDMHRTLNWLTTDNIILAPCRDSFWCSVYPYRLVNQQTGTSVKVISQVGPWVNGSYTRWIYSIDYHHCQLCLNDGSVWNIPYSDSWILDMYLPGDYMIMGFNDSPGSNILINYNAGLFVYASCILY